MIAHLPESGKTERAGDDRSSPALSLASRDAGQTRYRLPRESWRSASFARITNL
jgi:hypothetical protein